MPSYFAKKAESMFMRWKMTGLLREALRDKDPNTLQNLFARKGYEIGIYCNNPSAERIVLEEILEERTTMNLVFIFFKELGGRFCIEGRDDKNLWTELIQADASRLMQSAKTMTNVVDMLVDILGMPLPDKEILHMACEAGGWNVLLALGLKQMTQNEFNIKLNETWAPRILKLSNYIRCQFPLDDLWFAKVFLPILSYRTLVKFNEQDVKRDLMIAEINHRQEIISQKQIMLFLKKRENTSNGMIRVFDNEHLAQHIIQEIAFKMNDSSE